MIFLGGSILVAFLSIIYLYAFEESETLILEDTLELVLSVLMAIGAYGFLQVGKNIINE